ncbi:MAG: TolC family protein [Duncaniella sp.]|nr:TolC family protein [Duncaniella sp.]
MTRLLITLIIASVSLHSQADAWSLDSCITYAISHNISVRSAQLDNLGAHLAVTEAKDRFLPTLNAGAQQSWDFGRSLTSDNTYANRNISNFGWSVQLSLPIFQGLSALRQLRQAEAASRAGELQSLAVADEVTLSVMSLYLQALYNRELLAVSREQLRLTTTQLERQEALLEAGKVPEVDVIQARAQVATAEVDTVNAANNLRLSLIDLAQALEIKNTDEFDISPLPDSETAPILISLSEATDRALGGYSSILAARARVESADRAVDLARSGYLPRLSFNAGLGDSYYRMSGLYNNSFSRQMRDNFSKTLGFTLQIPIFDAFSTRNSIRRAQLNRRSANLDLERCESDLRKAVEQAWTQADGARKKLDASIIAAEASKAALDAMTEKYTYGKANASEWEQTRSNYITSLAEQTRAKYETILRTRILNFYAR